MQAHHEQPGPRPTIRDVAEHAGVSKSLVSLVLRGSSKVSPDRRAAVQQSIAELGYRPNAAARTLREGRSRAIGVLLNDVRHPWFIDLLDGLVSVLEADGRHLVLSGGGRLNRRMDDSVLRGFLELEADGFILAGTQANSPVIAEIAPVVPTVTVGWRDIDLPRVDAVANDDLAGAALATRHLIELGHRRIAHISGRVSGTSSLVGKLRQQGYEDTMRACGFGEYIRVEPGDFTEEAGYRATVRLLNGDQPPTAIFAVDDITCLGAQSAASEMNVGVPAGLSLVGYDNSYLVRLRSIWLTSVDSAGFDAGRLAARTLLARVADPARPAEVHLLDPTLQVRGSTAPPPPQLPRPQLPRPGLPRPPLAASCHPLAKSLSSTSHHNHTNHNPSS
jgi:DNA-binding LacI/PurR family transcriptional regulator